MKTRPAVFVATMLAMASTASAATIDFEDLTLSPNSHWNGPDPAGVDQPSPFGTTERVGSFISGGATFNNVHDLDFFSWGGWAYSNETDTTTPGFANQYSAYHLPGGGGDNSAGFAVAFGSSAGDSVITLPTGTRPVSMRVTNVTYAALSMLQGDSFAKKFGDDPTTVGTVETDFPDWFRLEIIGLDPGNQQVGSVDFYLADYRFDNDYVIDQWSDVDLSSLTAATKLTFALTSSDVGAFGVNTPAYFAMDNLVVQNVPEPAAAMIAGVAFFGVIVARRRQKSTVTVLLV